MQFSFHLRLFFFSLSLFRLKFGMIQPAKLINTPLKEIDWARLLISFIFNWMWVFSFEIFILFSSSLFQHFTTNFSFLFHPWKVQIHSYYNLHEKILSRLYKSTYIFSVYSEGLPPWGSQKHTVLFANGFFVLFELSRCRFIGSHLLLRKKRRRENQTTFYLFNRWKIYAEDYEHFRIDFFFNSFHWIYFSHFQKNKQTRSIHILKFVYLIYDS